MSRVTISGSRISGLTYNESPGSWNSDLTFRVQAPLLRWVLGLASWVPPLGYRLLGPRSHLWDWSWVLGLGSNRDSQVLALTFQICLWFLCLESNKESRVSLFGYAFDVYIRFFRLRIYVRLGSDLNLKPET